jgi:hypothetical protein
MINDSTISEIVFTYANIILYIFIFFLFNFFHFLFGYMDYYSDISSIQLKVDVVIVIERVDSVTPIHYIYK